MVGAEVRCRLAVVQWRAADARTQQSASVVKSLDESLSASGVGHSRRMAITPNRIWKIRSAPRVRWNIAEVYHYLKILAKKLT
jgi:hypothetical protein